MRTRRTILSGLFLASAVPAAGLALRPAAPAGEVIACGPTCGGEALHTVTRVATVLDDAAPADPVSPFLLRCPVCGRGLAAEQVEAATL